MASVPNLDHLNELAAKIDGYVVELHQTAEHYSDSNVTSVFRDRLTNTLYSHAETAMHQATAEIQRLKNDFEEELRVSRAAIKELRDQRRELDRELDELAIARQTLAEKEKATVEERNTITRQHLVLVHDEEHFDTKRREHEHSMKAERIQLHAIEKELTVRETQLLVRTDVVEFHISEAEKAVKAHEENVKGREDRVKDREDALNLREREAAASGIAKIVDEAQENVREVGRVAKRELSTQQEHSTKHLENLGQLAKQPLTTQDDHSDRVEQDLGRIVSSIADLALQSRQQVDEVDLKLNDILDGNTESNRELKTLSIALDDMKKELPVNMQTQLSDVDFQLDSIIEKIDGLRGDVSSLVRRGNTSAPFQLTRHEKRPSDTSLLAPETSRRRRQPSPSSGRVESFPPSRPTTGSETRPPQVQDDEETPDPDLSLRAQQIWNQIRFEGQGWTDAHRQWVRKALADLDDKTAADHQLNPGYETLARSQHESCLTSRIRKVKQVMNATNPEGNRCGACTAMPRLPCIQVQMDHHAGDFDPSSLARRWSFRLRA